jgi:hypothetical protein
MGMMTLWLDAGRTLHMELTVASKDSFVVVGFTDPVALAAVASLSLHASHGAAGGRGRFPDEDGLSYDMAADFDNPLSLASSRGRGGRRGGGGRHGGFRGGR